MTWVKVCGLRTARDVRAAVEAGADALGFVIDRRSPRGVGPEAVRDLLEGQETMGVLVTVDVPPHRILEALRRTGARGAQPHGLHGPEASAAAAASGYFVLRPLAVRGQVPWDHVPSDQTPLLDAHVPGRHGGTGSSFDWDLIGRSPRPYVLAGGLSPGSVAGAIGRLCPWGVDASSGLESAPGIKDPELIQAFVQEAKRA